MQGARLASRARVASGRPRSWWLSSAAPACLALASCASGASSSGGDLRAAAEASAAMSGATPEVPSVPTGGPTTDASSAASSAPVVDVEVDVTGTGLTRHALAGRLGVWSGPPGGPLGLSVEAFDRDDGALEQTVRARLGASIEGLTSTRVTAAGQDRAAVAFTTGQSHARSEHCAFVVRRAGASGPGVLVMALAGLGQGPADCARVVAHPSLAKALGSLRLR
jgi:hypothetical protein